MMNGINGFDEMVMTSTGSIYNATICFPKLINYKIWNYGIGSVEDVDLATETGFVRGLPPSADTVDLGKDVKLLLKQFNIFRFSFKLGKEVKLLLQQYNTLRFKQMNQYVCFAK